MLVATFFPPCCKVRKSVEKNTKSKVGGFVRSQMIYIYRSQKATKMTTSRKHPNIFHCKTLLKSDFWPKKAIPKIPPLPSPARKIFGTAADGTERAGSFNHDSPSTHHEIKTPVDSCSKVCFDHPPRKTHILAPENWWLEVWGPAYFQELSLLVVLGVWYFVFVGRMVLFLPPHHPSVEGTSESSGKACSCWGRLVGELVGGGNFWKQWVLSRIHRW